MCWPSGINKRLHIAKRTALEFPNKTSAVVAYARIWRKVMCTSEIHTMLKTRDALTRCGAPTLVSSSSEWPPCLFWTSRHIVQASPPPPPTDKRWSVHSDCTPGIKTKSDSWAPAGQSGKTKLAFVEKFSRLFLEFRLHFLKLVSLRYRRTCNSKSNTQRFAEAA